MRDAGRLGLMVCCALVLAAPSTASAAVGCGDTLDHDVKLKQDLDCSAFGGHALTVGDDGVTVDLNGHKLIGQDGLWAGISDEVGFDNLTVKDGTIEGFDRAIDLYNDRHVSLSHLQVNLQETNDNYGLYVGKQRDLDINHVDVDNTVRAYYVYDSKGVTLRHSKVTNSDPDDTYAVYVGSNSGRHSITIDDVKANGTNYGFYIFGASTGTRITDSVANNATYAGFYIANNFDPRDYTLSRNTANGPGDYGFFASKKVAGSNNEASGHAVEDCLKVNCS